MYRRVFTALVAMACMCTLAGCGGSLGSDPTSQSGASSGTTPATGASSSSPGGVAQTPGAPTAADGSLASVMGAASTGTLSGQGTGALTYAISTPPQSGSATLTNASTGAFTYTSFPNFIGQDSLQFTVTDSSGTSQPATETLNVTSPAIGAEQTVANVGVNLDWVCYWCVGQPFVDIVRQASQFDDRATGTRLIEEGKLDSQGWPTTDFSWMALCCVNSDGSTDDPGVGSPLFGKYQLSFNGIAHIGDDGGTVEDQHYDPATNTTTATLDQTPLNKDGTGFDMLLGFVNTQRSSTSATGTGITNLRIIRPQFAPNGTKWWDSPTQEFTDPFLDALKGFSTIRYMNWTGPLGSPEVNWSDRTPANWPVAGHLMEAASASLPYLVGPGASCTQYCDWYSTGEPWETAIDLANATHTDMWINIPTLATDDYVKSLATLLKTKLDPGLHVYVEWTDELWNYGAPYWTGGKYNEAQFNALVASNATEAANYQANCVSYADWQCHIAERVMQFGQDFASVYGASAINTTIRPVLCMQFAGGGNVEQALRFIALTYGEPAKYFYGICGAPYWNVPSKTTLPSGTTAAGAVAALNQAIANNAGSFKIYTATALFYGLHNLAYEGGPDNLHFTVAGDTGGKAALALANAVQMAPGMQGDVNQGLTNAFANGTDLYMYYSLQGSGGRWGASNDALDLHAPKLLGLTKTAGQLVTRDAGTTLPGTIDTSQPDFFVGGGVIGPAPGIYCAAAGGGYPAHCAWNGSNAKGSGLGFLVNVPKAGNYTFSIVMDAYVAHGSLALEVDQKSVATFNIPNKGPNIPLTLAPTTEPLTAGLHLVELVDAIGKSSYGVDSIKVAGN